jgi:hypothetical protein
VEDHRTNRNAFRNGFRLVIPRHVPHFSAHAPSLSCNRDKRQVLCHVLLIFSATRPFKYHLHHGISSCHLRPCNSLTMASFSRSSSLTITSTSSAPTSPAYSSTSTILQDEKLAIKLETERDEARFEFYGGNDPEDPPPKNFSSSSPLPFLPKPNTDPNIVTWDGPEDPENPQNWSVWYRWCITIACTVMTLNVYVPLDRGDLLSSTLADIVLAGRSLLLRHPLQCQPSLMNSTSRGK